MGRRTCESEFARVIGRDDKRGCKVAGCERVFRRRVARGDGLPKETELEGDKQRHASAHQLGGAGPDPDPNAQSQPGSS